MKDFCETIGCLNKPATNYQGKDLCKSCLYEQQNLGDIWPTKKVN